MSLTLESPASQPLTAARRSPADSQPRRRIGGLDGLRAIAVLAVIVYHFFPSAASGGFLGVDLFFVISGFLITALLVAESRESGRIALGEFWRRRARRLLPALGTMLLLTGAAALVIGGELLIGIGRQLAGAATFSYNWLAISAGSDYYSSTAPELYRNLWSLAVEEQFYLLWPAILVVLLLIRSTRLRFWILVAAACASMIGMLTLTLVGADPTRVYFGTDTHSLGLLAGAAVALSVSTAGNAAPATSRLHALGTAVLRWSMFVPLLGLGVFAFIRFDDDAPINTALSVILFTGLACATIALLVRLPSAGALLDNRPMRWIGERSYGLYLWHWPILVLLTAMMRPGGTDPVALGLVSALAAVLTVAAAAASYRWIEAPIRRRGFRGALSSFRCELRLGTVRSRLTVLIAPILVLSLGTAVVTAALAEPTESVAAVRIRDGQAIQAAATAKAAAERATVPQAAERSVVLPPRPTGEHVTVIGDSVTLASLPELLQVLPGALPDAKVSRPMSAAPELLRALDAQGGLRDYVVVALGTNGSISRSTLEEIRGLIGEKRKLVLVTAFADRSWTPGVNATLHEFAAGNPGVAIADWNSAISAHTDLLAADRVHPGAAGGRIYAATVLEALNSLYTIPPELVDALIPEVAGTDLVIR